MELMRVTERMPDEIGREIMRRGLASAYEERPAYQKNDYLRWIGEARRSETREKRIRQMLEELRQGDVYMNMDWPGGRL